MKSGLSNLIFFCVFFSRYLNPADQPIRLYVFLRVVCVYACLLQEMLAFLRRQTSVKPAKAPAPPEAVATGQRVRVEGLRKSPYYNGLFARVGRSLEGGRYRVVLEEQDAKVLSLKAHNLIPVDKPVCSS